MWILSLVTDGHLSLSVFVKNRSQVPAPGTITDFPVSAICF